VPPHHGLAAVASAVGGHGDQDGPGHDQAGGQPGQGGRPGRPGERQRAGPGDGQLGERF
jgi:hypothetical protein